MREIPSATSFSTFLCKQTKKKIKQKNKKAKYTIYIYIYGKVDQKPEREVYVKGEQKKEHERAC